MCACDFSPWNRAFDTGVVDLWHEVFSGSRDDFKMDPRKFEAVTSNSSFSAEGAQVATKDHRVVGFVLATDTDELAFLSVLMVHPDFRKQGIGASLLRRSEDFVRARGKEEIRVSYKGNPISFATGADVSTPGYYYLVNNGYRNDGSLSLLMDLTFDKFEWREEIDRYISGNNANGIRFSLCGNEHRDGLVDFMSAVFPGGWEASVNAHLVGDSPYPVMVAAEGKRVVGFAGPIRVSDGGVGGFTGIGTHPDFRRRKIGMVLFNLMCAEFKKRGATRSTLHTGLNNPAQEIYLGSGYRVRTLLDYSLIKKLV
jgi:ribosomal protein S18 acetylase RimI-like enzyme